MIAFDMVTKVYEGGTKAVDSVSFTVDKGEFFVLIGPSGSGKTTTLKMMNRLISLTEGAIFIDGKNINDYKIDELRWNMGYVLQQIALFPHMTIEENISIVPELKQWKKETIRKRVDELLEMVGLEPNIYRSRMPHELSGGQQQRIGVVRALAADPDIILMDEPFSALDPISRERLQEDMIQLKETINKTIVFVTHDINEAVKLADRICLMENGKVVQLGTPEELLTHPANDFVQNFVSGVHRGNHHFDLEKSIHPLHEETPQNRKTVSVSAPLEDVLHELAEHEHLTVEKNGKPIGVIDRQGLIQYLSRQMEGGVDSE